MNTLLILTRDQQKYAERVRDLNLPELTVLAPESAAEIAAAVSKANIAFANPRIACEHISDWKQLEWLQSTFAGIDALTATGLPRDYILTNVKDVYGLPMAEYVFSYILMFERQVLENIEWQRKKEWVQKPYPMLSERVLGIAGTGSIGREIARVARTFGMRVIGLRRSDEPLAGFDAVYTQESSSDFLQQSDYLVSVLPHTEETDGFFDADRFRQMKPEAVFLNIGRGSAVVAEDLRTALTSKHIKAAVLDVFATEPLPEESPLWETESLYLTPHVSGYVTHNSLFEIFKENYLRFLRGEDLQYQVDFERGY